MGFVAEENKAEQDRKHNIGAHSEKMQIPVIMLLRITTLMIKFVLTIFITKYIGLEALGAFGLLSAATIIVPVVFGLGLMQTISRRAVIQEPDELVTPIFFYLTYCFTIYFIIAALCVFMPAETISPTQKVLILGILFFEHINFDSYQFLANRFQLLFANILHFIRYALWAVIYMMIAWIFPALRNLDVLLMLWLFGAGMAVLGYGYALRLWPWAKVALNMKVFRAWFHQECKRARALYLSSVATTFSMQSDRFIISFLLGLELTGIYVFFQQIGSALSNLFYTAVIQTYRPKMVATRHRNLKRFQEIYRSMIVKTIVSTSLVSGFTAIIAYQLLPLLDNALLVDWQFIFWPILMAFCLNVLAEAQRLVFYSQEQDNTILFVTLVLVVMSFLLTVLLINLFGLWGAGAAILCVSIIRTGLQNIFVRRSLSDLQIQQIS